MRVLLHSRKAGRFEGQTAREGLDPARGCGSAMEVVRTSTCVHEEGEDATEYVLDRALRK